MAMEITGKPPANGVSGYVQTVRDTKVQINQPADGRAAPAGGDTVRLSDDAREVQAAVRVMQQLPDIRTDRVAELKRKLDQGTYRPDGRRIAFNLLKQSFLDEIE